MLQRLLTWLAIAALTTSISSTARATLFVGGFTAQVVPGDVGGDGSYIPGSDTKDTYGYFGTAGASIAGNVFSISYEYTPAEFPNANIQNPDFTYLYGSVPGFHISISMNGISYTSGASLASELWYNGFQRAFAAEEFAGIPGSGQSNTLNVLMYAADSFLTVAPDYAMTPAVGTYGAVLGLDFASLGDNGENFPFIVLSDTATSDVPEPPSGLLLLGAILAVSPAQRIFRRAVRSHG